MIRMIKEAAISIEALESIRREKGKGARTPVNKENDKPGLGGSSGREGAGVTGPMATGRLGQVE